MNGASAQFDRILMDRYIEEARRLARVHQYNTLQGEYLQQKRSQWRSDDIQRPIHRLIETGHASKVHPVEKVQPSWRQMLGRLGTWLVIIGERLEQYAPAQPSHERQGLEQGRIH